METPKQQFLDVDRLLESSEVQTRGNYLPLIFGVVVLLTFMVGQALADAMQASPGVVTALKLAVMTGVLIGVSSFSVSSLRRYQRQQLLLQSIDELMHLRRWPEAGTSLERLLSRPARLPQVRVQALIYLGGVLSRYHRYTDAIRVYEYVLEQVRLDAPTDLSIRIGRAMAMLHEDHLVDADRAISELRRHPAGGASGAVALVEIYRDVKTGHMDDAIRLAIEKRDPIRLQLGHRCGDVHALVARAYDVLNQPEAAQKSYRAATLLQPEVELQRRYAEVARLAGKYAPAQQPQGDA